MLAAPDLAEAEGLIRNDPDYLSLGLMPPDGDGISRLRSVRSAGRSIRVAATAGSIRKERLESVRLLNSEVLLFKPIPLEDLLRGLGIDPR